MLLIEPRMPISEFFRNPSVRIVIFQRSENLVLIGEDEAFCVCKF